MDEQSILEMIADRGYNTDLDYVYEALETAVRRNDLESARRIVDAWQAASDEA